MAYSRESLNTAVSLKLADISQATGQHKALFAATQTAGVVGIAGALLIAPIAVEVGLITAAAGGVFYAISQLMQTKRTGHFLPLPGVPLSAGQLSYGFSSVVAQIMGSAPPAPPDEVRLLPSDWLPERERRINYLLTHCPDLIINAAENAQAGISFAAIVDSAVRASEYAISDQQLSDPVAGNKLAGEVRKVLTGDTSTIEARQTQAIAQEYQRAKLELAAGDIDLNDFAAIEAQVMQIAPDAIEALPAIASAEVVPVATGDNVRIDWREVFGLVADQAHYPAIVVIGPMGVGKTTLVNYLLSVIDRTKVVLDPHYEMGAWPGCKVIGAGMDYQAVGEALTDISADVKDRYIKRATQAGYRPELITLVLEEQTNWADKVPGAGKFLKESLSDIRKVGYQTISVAHADTNTARGGAVGTSKMREQGEFKIVLLEQGLAEVSVKGREKFKLRFPNPEPYTISTGEPVVMSSAAGSAAESAKPVIVDSAPVSAPVAVSSWSQFKTKLSDNSSPYIGFADWVESRNGQAFTIEQAKENKKARSTIPNAAPGNSQRDRVEHAIKCFAQWGALTESVDGFYTQA